MKLPTISLEKRDDRGGVYYWRAYLPRKKPEKGYNRVYRATNEKDGPRALKAAKVELEALLNGTLIISQPETAVISTGQKISEQADIFVARTMEFHSVSYRRGTDRSLGYLVQYVKSDDGKGEARDLIADITPLSLDVARGYMNKAREASGKVSYSFKYWAELLNDWDRFVAWQIKQKDSPLTQNYVADIPRPDKTKFAVRKEFWNDTEELEPFLLDCKDNDPELYELAYVIRWSSIDPADYFDFKPTDMSLKSDGHWYITKERAKEPGHFYNVPIDQDKLLGLFLAKKAECKSEDCRMFTGKWKATQRESWGTAISWRRKRVYERLFPGKKVKTFKDLRRTFSDYWQRKGISPAVIQVWMGHAEGSAVTQTNYSDWRLTGGMMKEKA